MHLTVSGILQGFPGGTSGRLGSLGSLASFSAPPSATLRSQRTLYIHAWSGSPLHTSVPAGVCHLTLSLGFGRQRRWPFKCPERFHPLVYSHGTPRWIGASQFLGLLSCLSDCCIHPQNCLQRRCPPPSEQLSLGSLGSPIPLSSPFPFFFFSANDFCS